MKFERNVMKCRFLLFLAVVLSCCLGRDARAQVPTPYVCTYTKEIDIGTFVATGGAFNVRFENGTSKVSSGAIVRSNGSLGNISCVTGDGRVQSVTITYMAASTTTLTSSEGSSLNIAAVGSYTNFNSIINISYTGTTNIAGPTYISVTGTNPPVGVYTGITNLASPTSTQCTYLQCPVFAPCNSSSQYKNYCDSINTPILVKLTIVPKVNIESISDLDFGAFLVTSSDAVIRANLGTNTTAFTSGTGTILAGGATAEVILLGAANTPYTVTLPTTATIYNGTNSLTISNFQHSAGASPQLTAAGEGSFYIGADLAVSKTTPPGAYVGTYNVIVNF